MSRLNNQKFKPNSNYIVEKIVHLKQHYHLFPKIYQLLVQIAPCFGSITILLDFKFQQNRKNK